MANKSPSTAGPRARAAIPARAARTAAPAAAASASAAAAAEIEAIADRLHSAAIHLLRRVRRVDLASGLTPARLSVLSVLVFGGPRTLGELAAAEQVSAPTITRLVAGLERDGLLQRAPDPHDRRITRAVATPRAAKIMQRGRQARVREVAASLATLPPDALQIVGRATEILRDLNARER